MDGSPQPPGARWTVAIALLQHLEVRQLQGDVILYSSVMPGQKMGREMGMATSASKNSWELEGFHGIYEDLMGFNGIKRDLMGFMRI